MSGYTDTGGVSSGGSPPSLTVSLHGHGTVDCSQFVRLMELFLADGDDDALTRQLMTFVCEGFVQSKDERSARRQQVRCVVVRLSW